MTKNIIIIGIAVLGLSLSVLPSCNSSTAKVSDSTKSYGKSFEINQPTDINTALKNFLDSGKQSSQVTGTIAKVCQTEGCWFVYKANDNNVMVWFNHEFTIDKNLKEKEAITQGEFYRDTTSVEELQEFAKDDGKSKEEIEKISEPKIEVKYRATGVKIK